MTGLGLPELAFLSIIYSILVKRVRLQSQKLLLFLSHYSKVYPMKEESPAALEEDLGRTLKGALLAPMKLHCSFVKTKMSSRSKPS